jgi:putative lipoprotein
MPAIAATASVTAAVRLTSTASTPATPISQTKPVTTFTVTTPVRLQDALWVLESYGKPDKPVKVLPQAPITARFGGDGAISGSAGCNDYSGTHVAGGDELSIGPLAVTRKACLQPVNQQEQTYLDAFQAARTFTISTDGRLRVTYPDGLLTFAAQAAAAAQPAPAVPITSTAGITGTSTVTATAPISATAAISATPQLTPRAPQQPVRIQFPKGSTSDKIEGHVEPGAPTLYVLRAAAGQTMTVQPSATKGSIQVSIVGADRRALASVTSPATWTGVLPASQDYYLTVSAPKGAPGTNYSLTIAIVGKTDAPPSPASEPTVIRFEPGSSTAQVSGQVKPGGSVAYTLNAKAGQKLTVSVSANGPMRVAIADPKGQLVGLAGPGAPWSGALPLTGEYRLTVQAPVDIGMVSYTLEITLR